MARWILINRLQGPQGVYIGWFRTHPEIHEKLSGSHLIYGKHSLVQIGGGGPRRFEVLGQTVMHPVFTVPPSPGTTLYKKIFYFDHLDDAKRHATWLKSELARMFDKVTRGD